MLRLCIINFSRNFSKISRLTTKKNLISNRSWEVWSTAFGLNQQSSFSGYDRSSIWKISSKYLVYKTFSRTGRKGQPLTHIGPEIPNVSVAKILSIKKFRTIQISLSNSYEYEPTTEIAHFFLLSRKRNLTSQSSPETWTSI